MAHPCRKAHGMKGLHGDRGARATPNPPEVHLHLARPHRARRKPLSSLLPPRPVLGLAAAVPARGAQEEEEKEERGARQTQTSSRTRRMLPPITAATSSSE